MNDNIQSNDSVFRRRQRGCAPESTLVESAAVWLDLSERWYVGYLEVKQEFDQLDRERRETLLLALMIA